jgi:hypothetical protein
LKIENRILKTLAYFDMFHYPLKTAEICRFLDQPADETALQSALNEMVAKGFIYSFKDFYSLHNDPSLVERRKSGNEQAALMLPNAYRIAGFLYKFPFVEGVGISGSLSKNFAGDKDDIDFFIITRSNKLWIARTLMHLFKKLTFIWGKQHWYCMNYYVDEDALLIGEKNIFTATEVVTLLPVCGTSAFRAFFKTNDWTNAYFPNDKQMQGCIRTIDKKTFSKKIIETIFDNHAGMRLDDFLMRITTKRWQEKEKQQQLNMKGDPVGLKTGKHFSRPNPEHFQKKILGRYAIKLAELEKKLSISLE